VARKKKNPPSEPSKAYLISFGDTMTALLAFFIVMNSLAKEQTGANLYAGTGSFVNSLNSVGLPGSFSAKSSENAFQRTEPGPLYIVDDQESKNEVDGSGPDDETNNERVIDREREMLQRFLIEVDQIATIRMLPQNSSTIVFDFFEPINLGKKQVVKSATLDVFRQGVTRLFQGDCQVEIVVWARMPSETAWRKAVDEASDLRAELIRKVGVSNSVTHRIHATGKPWFYSDQKRPRFSFIFKKRS